MTAFINMGKTIAAYALCALLGMFATACGPKAFSPHYPDNKVSALEAISEDLKAQPAPARPAMVFAVSAGNDPEIMAFDLRQGKQRWSKKAAIASRMIDGDHAIAYFDRDHRLHLLDRDEGHELWSTAIDVGARPLGVAINSQYALLSVEYPASKPGDVRARLYAYSVKNGALLWQRDARGLLGAPVISGKLVVLPFRFQSISFLDITSGREKARIRSMDEALTWLRSERGKLYYGSDRSIYTFGKASAKGRMDAGNRWSFQVDSGLHPLYWWRGYDASQLSYSAYDRNRLLWQGLSATEAIVHHHHRFLFAYQEVAGATPQLQWVYRHPKHDLVMSAIDSDNQLVAVDESGAILQLKPLSLSSKRSAIARPYAFGKAVIGATYSPEVAVGQGAADPSFASAQPAAKGRLIEELVAIVGDPDRRYRKVKLFALDQLSLLKDPRVAEGLVRVVSERRLDPDVYQKVAEVLVSAPSRDSLALYLKVLSERYDYIKGSKSHAVDIMAQALGAISSPEAVDTLLAHLGDHHTPVEALDEIARALTQIGDKRAVPHLKRFLLMYRADNVMSANTRALIEAGRALLVLGAAEERQIVDFVAKDSRSLPALREGLSSLLLP